MACPAGCHATPRDSLWTYLRVFSYHTTKDPFAALRSTNPALMPKPRARGAIGAPSYFSVSPWQDREDQRQSDDGPAGYSIVEMPLVVRSSGGAGTSDGSPLAAALQPDAMAMDVAGVEECAVLPSCQPSSAPAASPSAAGGGWLTKKRKQTEEGEAVPQQQASSAFPLSVRGSSVGEPDAAGAEQGGHGTELEGTAYLALLPNGSITGERGQGGNAERASLCALVTARHGSTFLQQVHPACSLCSYRNTPPQMEAG